MSEDVKVFNLGWAMVQAAKYRLTIVSPADDSEGFHSPAQTIRVWRPLDIEQLRAACDFALQSQGKLGEQK